MQTIQPKTEARVAIEPGFVWDGQNAYLFDIDGTLLRSRDRVHFESVANAVRRVTGFEVTLTGSLQQSRYSRGCAQAADRSHPRCNVGERRATAA
jgi:hypothetical protein